MWTKFSCCVLVLAAHVNFARGAEHPTSPAAETPGGTEIPAFFQPSAGPAISVPWGENWNFATSDLILTRNFCVPSWTDRVLSPQCFTSTYYYKLNENGNGFVALNGLGSGTFDGLYVRSGDFQVLNGTAPTAPVVYTGQGPAFLTLEIWRNAPGRPPIESDTIFLPGGQGALNLYSLNFAPDFQPATRPPAPAPPLNSDRLFVVPTSPGTCHYSADGNLTFDLPVTRFVSDTGPDGTLLHSSSLISLGATSATVKLQICAWDVDFQPLEPRSERDLVRFNGVPVADLAGVSNRPYLDGINNGWSISEFDLPIDSIRFSSAPGVNGPPAVGLNTVEIAIDVANPGRPTWCVDVAWLSLRMEGLPSPIILIHGINQTSDFWSRHSFVSALTDAHLPFTAGINLPPERIGVTANILAALLEAKAEEFGTDSLHLVAHSKGGLDAFLAISENLWFSSPAVRAVSLNTLSTPHDGSALADYVLRARDLAAARLSSAAQIPSPFAPPDQIATFIASALPFVPGYYDLGTVSSAARNRNMGGSPPGNCFYSSFGADANRDNSTGMLRLSYDEFEACLLDAPEFEGLPIEAITVIFNVMYDLVGGVRGEVQCEVKSVPFFGDRYFVRGVRTGAFVPNDTLVSLSSALGTQRFQYLTEFAASLVGSEGRNHSNIADSGVGAVVIPNLLLAERQFGDWTPLE